MKVDPNKVLTSLVIAAILAAAGAVWDFQNVKADVQGVKGEVKSVIELQAERYQSIKDELKEIKGDVKALLRGRRHERNQ